MMVTVFENLERRILAAFRAVDAFGRTVDANVSARCDNASFYRKRNGEWVVQSAEALPEHDRLFDAPPAAPAIGSETIEIDLAVLSGPFLSRRFALALPRDPDPANRNQADSLFRWQDVIMPYDPAASVAGQAALLTVSVERSDNQQSVEGAVVRVRPSGGLPERIGLTNALGEAMLAIPSVPLSNAGAGASVVEDLDADIDAIVDPATARFHALDETMKAVQAARERHRDFIDPDDVVGRLSGSATPAQTVQIAAGKRRAATVQWTPP